MKSLSKRLQEVHSALDDALGDSDCDYLSMRDLREERPVQWAATKLAKIMADLEAKERRKTVAPKRAAQQPQLAMSNKCCDCAKEQGCLSRRGSHLYCFTPRQAVR